MDLGAFSISLAPSRWRRGAPRRHIRAFVERAVTFKTCPECGGTRLAAAARSSKIGGVSIANACVMQITDLAAWRSARRWSLTSGRPSPDEVDRMRYDRR